MSSILLWRIRHWLWSNWLTIRHGLNKVTHIGPPPPNKRRLIMRTLKQKHGDKIPLDIPSFEKLPSDENKLGVNFVRVITLTLNRLFPCMQPGLPPIPEDIHRTMTDILTKNYVNAFMHPRMPVEYHHPVRLERLITHSPYAHLLHRNDSGALVWDFSHHKHIEHHPHVMSTSLVVFFKDDPNTKTITATEIHSDHFGIVRCGDPDWNDATRLAICSATTETALTRHFNYVHLVCGFVWAFTSRTELPIDHPIYRLLWPSNINSMYTLFGVTEAQLNPDGDFPNMFSFTHAGLMHYFQTMYERYRIHIMDPYKFWKARGLDDVSFESPAQRNLEQLFDIMHNHAHRYVFAYYDSDEALRADKTLEQWLAATDTMIPNGLGDFVDLKMLTRESLARLLGAVIYEGNTSHDVAGTTLWDYQLWVDRNPTRMHKDGSRVPLDVFHRVIMNNFALQLKRAPLLSDYSHVALDERGSASFKELQKECQQLQDEYNKTSGGLWRMEPKNLEINMNG